MDHNLCRENLSAYLDGELPQGERLALETHMAGCPECRAELAQLKAVSGLLKAHVMEPVPPALKGAVLKEKPRAASPWLKPVLALSTAAAALIVIYNITNTPEDSTYSTGFGYRAAGSLYDSGFSSREAAPAAEAAPDSLPAESDNRSGPRSVVSAVRGRYGQAKSAGAGSFSGMSAGGAAADSSLDAAGAKAKGTKDLDMFKASANKSGPLRMLASKPRAAAEFRGRVCVHVSKPASLNEADGKMYEALIFLKKTGAKVVPAEPGRLVFVKNDGGRVTLTEKDCAYGFIFFDGVRDPLPVTGFSSIAEKYGKYFGASAEPADTRNPD